MTTLYPQIMGREAMIASEHYLSAAAGARIFARGGNAIDAAVAATLVEGVVNPHMHTIGGEAPMLIYVANAQRVVSINGNMAAPARATIERFRSLGLDLIPGEGLLAAGVPSAFDALASALTRFGTMTLAEVMHPALALCEDGMPMHAGLSGHGDTPKDLSGLIGLASIRANRRKFREQWPTSAAIYMPNGEVPRPGDIIKNPALAKVFRRLLDAEAGAKNRGREAAIDAARDCFYRGEIAREIVKWSDANGGLLQESDLARFQTRFEEPVSADYHGVTVHKCQPWSQGPVFLQQLRLLEGYDLRAMGHNSAAYIHCLVEAAKLAFADREAYYADPEFTDVPMEALLSRKYADLRRDLIDADHASMDLRPGDPVAMRALLEGANAEGRSWGPGTIHVTAADGRGNMVACTASGGWIPSSPVIESLGFPLGYARSDVSSGRTARQRASSRQASSHHLDAFDRDSRRCSIPVLRYARAETSRINGRCSSSSTWSTSEWTCRRRSKLRAFRPPITSIRSTRTTSAKVRCESRSESTRRCAANWRAAVTVWKYVRRGAKAMCWESDSIRSSGC